MKPNQTRKYRVTVREVHTVDHLIEASSPEEAIHLVALDQGTVDEGSYDFSHQLDCDHWTVVEAAQD